MTTILLGGRRWLFVFVVAAGITLALVAAFAFHQTAFAAATCTDNWSGVNGDWSNAANWSSGVPTSSTNACLPAGSYTVTIAGEPAVTGTLSIGAGVNLSLQITGCSPASAVLALNGSMTNGGEVDLANLGDACGGTAQIIIPSGSVLTNSGTIAVTGCCRGDRELTGSVTNLGIVNVNFDAYSGGSTGVLHLDGAGSVFDNQGTVNIFGGMTLDVSGTVSGQNFINDSGGMVAGTASSGNGPGKLQVDGSNTFTEGAGTTSGPEVVLTGGGTLDVTGSGNSSFGIQGTDTISGNIASGQLVNVEDRNCSPVSAIAQFSGDAKNGGTINLLTINDACGGVSEIVIPAGHTLSNNGSITAYNFRGEPQLTGNVVNHGIVAINGSCNFQGCNSPVTRLNGSGATFDNYGMLSVGDNASLNNDSETLIPEPSGTITLNGAGSLYQGASATLNAIIDANPPPAYSTISGGATGPGGVRLAGTLTVTTIGTPSAGSSWPIISNTARFGTFATTNFNGINYTVDYLASGVTLVAPGLDSTRTQPSTSIGTITAPPGAGVPAGTVLYDAATVTANSTSQSPSGTVSFYVCSPAALAAGSATACSSEIGTHFDTETLPSGTGGPVTVFSTGQTVASAGTWCFAGYYSGDSTFPASADATTDECFAVNASSTSSAPSTTTGAVTAPPSGGVTQGTTMYDHANVSGDAAAGSPGGTVTFYACGPNVGGCTSGGTQVGVPVTLAPGSNNTSSAFSSGFVAPSPGTWCFAAYYAGSSSYPASSDTSSDECFTVNSAGSAFSQLDPGDTTCMTFAATPAPSNKVGPISYGLQSGSVNGVSPGVFLYYSEFTAAAGTTVDVRQSNNGPNQPDGTPWPNFRPKKDGQVILYDANCNLLSKRAFTLTTLPGNVLQIEVTIPASASGTEFIIGIKFDSETNKGALPPAGNSPTIVYTFSTVSAGFTESSAQLTLQPR
jgi:hypothetical protein